MENCWQEVKRSVGNCGAPQTKGFERKRHPCRMFLSKMHNSGPASCLFCRGVTILCAKKDRAAGTSSPPAFGSASQQILVPLYCNHLLQRSRYSDKLTRAPLQQGWRGVTRVSLWGKTARNDDESTPRTGIGTGADLIDRAYLSIREA